MASTMFHSTISPGRSGPTEPVSVDYHRLVCQTKFVPSTEYFWLRLYFIYLRPQETSQGFGAELLATSRFQEIED
jgi:hypothetical protein